MGPLVPDIVGPELNYIAALIIGIFFGVILEQAGFSTSKKLVGLFYGYDFTVLRVFFTAGVVAMIGVIAFEHFGLLDISLTYINPTFLWSAIVGGLIMGLGFVIGGFCPGTSICAAAIGKIDAMIFVAGSFIGVFIFAEGYPIWEGLYKAESWGNVRVFDLLGMQQTVFAFILTAIALSMFWMVSIIENKVNGIKKPVFRFTPYYVTLGIIGFVLSVSAFVLTERKDHLQELVSDKEFVNSYNLKSMTVDELAYRLIKNDNRLQIIDFRLPLEFKKESLPGSTSFTFDNLFEKEPGRILSIRHKINLFVAEDEFQERQLAIVANKLGFKNIIILEGGLNKFNKEILEFDKTLVANNKREEDTYRFRTKASSIIPVLIKENKSAGPVKKTQKRIIGGC
ncbi:MAG: YeeE/YedE thiosulfate transporter family protein [Ignavibacterium sp.]|jgi:rhodanese-related sulfurtransferase|nr:YeeE/YedE thiosulfate transporter family protein [Ignavibacterium sp.]